MARLSKSRIMSLLQCPKRLYLEVHRRDLVQYSAAQEAAFAVGHQVGDIAIKLYDDGRGTYIDYDRDSLQQALAHTRTVLGGLLREPVFEATLEHDGVLVREDVLLPNAEGWHVIEVKASTSLKPQYLHDCAVQAWVHTGAGYPLDRISLAHVDNQFVYPGDGDYRGLLKENDLTTEVTDLLPGVTGWVSRAKAAATGPEPDVGVGSHCYSPYECPFVHYCWPSGTEHPVQGLKGSKKKLGELIAAGYRDIRDVPAAALDGATHQRIWRVTRAGKPEILPDAGRFIRDLAYPRYYLDFETIGPPVPRWPGTRPYEVIPFQWSCHVETGLGQLGHHAFLDTSGDAPMRACAETLLTALGDTGPVLVYTNYERGVLQRLADRFPDLAPALLGVVERLVDLAPVTKQAYYHPDMHGSWSLKAVLPTLETDIDYAALDGVSEGTEASAAYFRAIEPGRAADEVERIREELLEYCRLDTLALVRLAEFFARH